MTGKVANMSNYPSGFNAGLLLNGEPLTRRHPGKVFYVADGDTAGNTAAFPNRKGASDGNKGTFLDPFKTLDYAVGQCTADRGDIIYVLPGYVQSITTEGAIELDVEGVAVVGLGTTDENMPLLSFDAVAAEVDVAAAGVTISGLHLAVEADEITNMLNVADGSDGLHFVSNLVTDDGVETSNVAGAILEIATSDELVISGNRLLLEDTEVETVSAVEVTGASRSVQIRDNLIKGAFSTAALSNTAADEQWVVTGNTFWNEELAGVDAEPSIEVHASTTGYYANNTYLTGAVADAINVAAAMFDAGGNSYTATAGTAPVVTSVGNMRAYTAAEVTIDGTSSEIGFAGIVGTVALWGAFCKASDGGLGAASKFDLGVEGDLTAIWSALDVDAEAVGDVIQTTAAEAAMTVIEVAGNFPATSCIWPAPLILTAGEIDATGVEIETTATSGVTDFVFIYAPVSVDGAIGA